jgi:hypothetical protein
MGHDAHAHVFRDHGKRVRQQRFAVGVLQNSARENDVERKPIFLEKSQTKNMKNERR